MFENHFFHFFSLFYLILNESDQFHTQKTETWLNLDYFMIEHPTHDGKKQFNVLAVVRATIVIATECNSTVVVGTIFTETIQVTQIRFEKILKILF